MKMRYHWIIYAFVVSLPLYAIPPINLETTAIRWDWLFLAALIAIITAGLLLRQRFAIRRSMVFIWLLLFNLSLAMSAYGPLMSMEESRLNDFATTFAQYVFMSLAFVVIVNLKVRWDDLQRILKLYVIVSIVVAAIGVAQFIGVNQLGLDLYFDVPSAKFTGARSGYEFRLGGIQRATSLFVEPRHFGVFLAPALLVLLTSTLHGFPLKLLNSRFLTTLSGLILGLGVLTSLALSAYLASGLCMITVPFFLRKKRKTALTGVATAVVAVVILLSGFEQLTGVNVGSYVQTRLWPDAYSVANVLDFDTDLGGPARYIRGFYLAASLAVSHPITGIGPNQFEYMSNADVVVLPPSELLASVGLLGVACFAMFVATLLKRLYHVRPDVGDSRIFLLDAGLILLLTSLITSIFGSKFNYVSPWFWWGVIFAGWVYFTARRSDQNASKSRLPLRVDGGASD